MTDDPAKPPRFPYVAALLCVACVGAAAWTWVRYSYCWDLDLSIPWGPGAEKRFSGAYVRTYYDAAVRTGRLHVNNVSDDWLPPNTYEVFVDEDASRLHGASVAGLVVGAMGVFVFAVALRHWLRERRSAMGLEVP